MTRQQTLPSETGQASRGGQPGTVDGAAPQRADAVLSPDDVLLALPPPPCEYQKNAEYLIGAVPEDCHPALYTRRFEVAEALYKAADDPLAIDSRRLIAGVAFLCYRLRSSLK